MYGFCLKALSATSVVPLGISYLSILKPGGNAMRIVLSGENSTLSQIAKCTEPFGKSNDCNELHPTKASGAISSNVLGSFTLLSIPHALNEFFATAFDPSDISKDDIELLPSLK